MDKDLVQEQLAVEEEEYVEVPFDEEAFQTILRLYDRTFKDLVNR